MNNILFCEYSVDPVSTKPFQIHVKYEGDKAFQTRLFNIASENKIKFGYKTEEDSLISSIFSFFGSKKRLVSTVEIYKSSNIENPSNKRLPNELELFSLLNGEAYFSFSSEEDIKYFGDMIQIKLNKIIDKEFAIYQDLLNHNLSKNPSRTPL